MKYIKKPIIVEAQQWFRGIEIDGVCKNCTGLIGEHIHTLEGIMFLSDGDYVNTGIKGEKYPPCKPDIFEASYDCYNE